jgi:hypothetical protein
MGQRTWRIWASMMAAFVICALISAIVLRGKHRSGSITLGLANFPVNEWPDQRFVPGQGYSPTDTRILEILPATKQERFITGTLSPVLKQAVQHALSADRIQVTWNEPGSHATLIKVGSRSQLTLTALTVPNVQNVITVVNNIAYIEDHGYRLNKQLARFVVPVNDTFSFDIRHHWEDDLIAASADQLSITSDGLLKTYTVTDSTLTTFTYEFLFSNNHSISIPSWSNRPDDIALTWDDELPSGRPDWLEPIAKISIHPQLRSAIDGSQCGAPPFVPTELPPEMDALPIGAEFVCQVNLADVPRELGLPTKGLLQFFIVNEFESGFVRYFPAPLSATQNLVAATQIPISPKANGALQFGLFYTADNLDIAQRAPRSERFEKAPTYSAQYREPGSEFISALALRGSAFTANDVHMMGGHWDANGETEPGYTRLFMIGDDVGYSYWHIPTSDISTARFDRVVGGWTD